MVGFVLSLPTALGAALFAGLAVLIALLPYRLVLRRTSAEATTRHRALIGDLVGLVAPLYGFMLALVLSDAQDAHNAVVAEVEQEARAVAAVHLALGRLPPSTSAPMRLELRGYAQAIVDEEWPRQADRGLSTSVSERYERLLASVLDYAPTANRDLEVRQQVLSGLGQLQETRTQRLISAARHPGGLFWFIALVGFVMLALGLLVHRAERRQLWLVATWAAYLGVVMFLVLRLSQPFAGESAVQPEALRALLAS